MGRTWTLRAIATPHRERIPKRHSWSSCCCCCYIREPSNCGVNDEKPRAGGFDRRDGGKPMAMGAQRCRKGLLEFASSTIRTTTSENGSIARVSPWKSWTGFHVPSASRHPSLDAPTVACVTWSHPGGSFRRPVSPAWIQHRPAHLAELRRRGLPSVHERRDGRDMACDFAHVGLPASASNERMPYDSGTTRHSLATSRSKRANTKDPVSPSSRERDSEHRERRTDGRACRTPKRSRDPPQ